MGLCLVLVATRRTSQALAYGAAASSTMADRPLQSTAWAEAATDGCIHGHVRDNTTPRHACALPVSRFVSFGLMSIEDSIEIRCQCRPRPWIHLCHLAPVVERACVSQRPPSV